MLRAGGRSAAYSTNREPHPKHLNQSSRRRASRSVDDLESVPLVDGRIVNELAVAEAAVVLVIVVKVAVALRDNPPRNPPLSLHFAEKWSQLADGLIV